MHYPQLALKQCFTQLLKKQYAALHASHKQHWQGLFVVCTLLQKVKVKVVQQTSIELWAFHWWNRPRPTVMTRSSMIFAQQYIHWGRLYVLETLMPTVRTLMLSVCTTYTDVLVCSPAPLISSLCAHAWLKHRPKFTLISSQSHRADLQQGRGEGHPL